MVLVFLVRRVTFLFSVTVTYQVEPPCLDIKLRCRDKTNVELTSETADSIIVIRQEKSTDIEQSDNAL